MQTTYDIIVLNYGKKEVMVKNQKILRCKTRETTDLNIVPLYLRVRKCYLRSEEVMLIAKLISGHFTSQFLCKWYASKKI